MKNKLSDPYPIRYLSDRIRIGYRISGYPKFIRKLKLISFQIKFSLIFIKIGYYKYPKLSLMAICPEKFKLKLNKKLLKKILNVSFLKLSTFKKLSLFQVEQLEKLILKFSDTRISAILSDPIRIRVIGFRIG
jgi:hypothetical protein